MSIFYIETEKNRIFDCGFRKGFLQLCNVNNVELLCYYKKSKRYRRIKAGSNISIDKIDPYCVKVVSKTIEYGSFTLRNIISNNVYSHSISSLSIDYDVVSFPLLLECDTNRDCEIDDEDNNKSSWSWGKGKHGAIVLANNNKGTKERFSKNGHDPELAEFIVRSTGLEELKYDLQLRLYATPISAQRFAVYKYIKGKKPEKVLGTALDEDSDKTRSISRALDVTGEKLFLEVHEYPNEWFDGLITIELHLRQFISEKYIGPLLASDRIVFRVAPWMMLPDTASPKTVYLCELSKGSKNNSKFINTIGKICADRKIELVIIDKKYHEGDRWIQDEIEFGYCQSPSHNMHVVFDSPRDGKLDKFPEEKLLGENIGHFQLGGSSDNSLDSFGNLTVSPPVKVNKRKYPFGRIIFGGRSYGDLGANTRKMMPILRRFLYAQKIQSPFEILTDWLRVGHVDEIISFVPYKKNDFKVLIASPKKTIDLLKELKRNNKGGAILFKDKKDSRERPVEESIDDLLDNEDLMKKNLLLQEYMNLNRASLIKYLDLDPSDIIDIPVLYHVFQEHHGGLKNAYSYFPNMINQLVLEDISIVPKPFGPIINNKCAFEATFREAVPWRDVEFIDDWDWYHLKSGNIHCATNVLREIPEKNHWWEFMPDYGYDV